MTRQYFLVPSSTNNLQFNRLQLIWSLVLFYFFCSVILLNNKQVNCNEDVYFDSPGEDEDEFRESEALMDNEQIQKNFKRIGENLVEKVGGSVKAALAPARNYYNLVNRYHVWFRDYKKLQKLSKNSSMKSATEVLREEYAKVDKILYEEECSSTSSSSSSSSSSSDPKDISDDPIKAPKSYADKLESVDFVFNVLRKVIDRLEQSLAKFKSEHGLKVKRPENLGLKLLLADFPIDKKNDDRESELAELDVKENDSSALNEKIDDEQVKVAMERVKRTVLRAATNVVANEALVVANLALVSTAINSMSSLSYLAPIVTLLGSADTPLTVWYLRNLELRAALAVINRVKPLSFLNCDLKSQKDKN